ncbi:MAG TPA: hypothetical protein VGW31_11005 [Hanamia sp.]|nr:hypothetical protein [Hanamia sp.]
MKKLSLLVMVLAMSVVIYFFIKEQFKRVTLSHEENMTLSIIYLVIGLCMLILARINYLEKRKKAEEEEIKKKKQVLKNKKGKERKSSKSM